MKAEDHREDMVLRRIARGAVHTLSSAYAGRFVNWIAVFVLTRELAPEDFGHVALAASLLAMVASLRNFGLQNALLHHHDRVHQLAPTHFLLNTGLSAIGAIGAIGLAVLFVDGHYGRSVATALAVFAAFDLIRATAQTAETQLRRDLEFSFLAWAHAVALIAAATAGIALVFLGGGIWALILSHSAYGTGYVVVYCTLLWNRRSPLRFNLADFDRDGARRLFGYGAWIWVGAMLQTFLLNFDRLVVGAMLDARTLGFYERAHVFAQLPTGSVTHALTGIMIAVFARYQQDRKQLADTFRTTLWWIMRSAAPLSILLAIEISAVTSLLLGETWVPMVPILRSLLLYSLCRPLLEAVQTLLRSIGDPQGFAAVFSVQAAVLLVAAPLFTYHLGIEGTALSMNLTALVGTVLALRRSSRFVDVTWIRSFSPPLVAASAAAALRLSVAPLMDGLSKSSTLVLGIAVFVFAYGAVLLAVERQTLLGELRKLRVVFRKNGEGPE